MAYAPATGGSGGGAAPAAMEVGGPANSREHYAQASRERWLLPEEILDVLLHHDALCFYVSGSPPSLPPTGAMLLFDRRSCKRFRRDGHNWLTRKSGGRIREDHVKLRVGGLQRVAAAHAHSADVAAFHRRTYHLAECEGGPAVDEAAGSFSLVHYRLCGSREDGVRTVRRKEAVERKARADAARRVAEASATLDGSLVDDDVAPEIWAEFLGSDDDGDEGGGAADVSSAAAAGGVPLPGVGGGRVAGAVDATRGTPFPETRLEREARASPAVFAARIAEIAPAWLPTAGDDARPGKKDRFLVALDRPVDAAAAPADGSPPLLRAGERLAVRFSGLVGGAVVAAAHMVNPYTLRVGVPPPRGASTAAVDVVAAASTSPGVALEPRPLTAVLEGAVTWGAALAPPPPPLANDDDGSASAASSATASSLARTEEDDGAEAARRPAKVRVLRAGPAAAAALPPRPPTRPEGGGGLAELDADALASLSEAELDAAVEQLMLRVVGQMGRLAATDRELVDELDAPDAHGLGLLHYCALYNLDALIAELVAKGAAPDGHARARDAPLHLAASGGHVGAVRALLRGGADARRRDARNRTPRDRAADRGHARVAALLADAEDRGVAEDARMVDARRHDGGAAPGGELDDEPEPRVSYAALLHTAFSSLSLHEKCALSIARQEQPSAPAAATTPAAAAAREPGLADRLADLAPALAEAAARLADGARLGDAPAPPGSFATTSVISDSDQESLDVAMSLMAADERRELEDEARVITTNVKAWIVRRNYIKVREAARTLEARWIQRRSTSRADGLGTPGHKRAHGHHDAARGAGGRVLETVPEDSAASDAPNFVKLQAASRGMLARRQLNQLKQQMLALLVISRNFRSRLKKEPGVAFS